MRSTAPPVAVGTVKNSKIIDGPHTLVKTGYAKQQVINTTTVARSLCIDMLVSFLSTVDLAR